MTDHIEALYEHREALLIDLAASLKREDALIKQLAECQAKNAKLAERVVGVGEIAINSVSRQALAECQAREKVLRDALEYVNPQSRNAALAMPSDSTALDELKRQWQREALVNIAVAVKEMGVFNYSVESIVEEIYNRAKELE
jgi:hypothetical protein